MLAPATIVVPTYNRAALLPRAIESVLSQLAPDDELLVVDDGSTDATAEVLARYGDRVRHIRVAHGGAGRARNIGWQLARHPLIGFLDSDDEWLPGKLSMQRALLAARPDLVFCCGDFTTRTTAGEILRRNLASWHGDPRPWSEILGPPTSLARLAPGCPNVPVHIGSFYGLLLQALYVSLSLCLIRRERAGRDLGCAEDLPTFEDWEAAARLARRGPAAFIDHELIVNHGHGGSRLTGADWLIKLECRLTFTERVWGTDPEFLAAEGEAYAARRRALLLAIARESLARGDTAHARQAIARAGSSPFAYRLLASLPGPVTRHALELRRLGATILMALGL